MCVGGGGGGGGPPNYKNFFAHSFVIGTIQPFIILDKRPRVQLVIISCKIGLEDHICCAEIYY